MVVARLSVLGFSKRKPGVLTLKMSADTVGWIGLNTANRNQPGLLELNLVIGIRNQRIERLVADLLHERFDEVIPPTLARHIGYLMPSHEYQPYVFLKGGNVEETISNLVRDVREFGLPFINLHADLAYLVSKLGSRDFGADFMAAYRIPAGLFLLGQMDDASRFITTELEKVEGRGDAASMRFRSFGTSLISCIKSRCDSRKGLQSV